MLTIPMSILVEAGTFFEERGSLGCEGTAMIAGTDGVATKLVIPEQHANPVPYCSVEVTRRGKTELALALGPNDRYMARIHSHPALAFHSPTDDANPAITYPGALSIVVPFFGLGLRRGLDACAVLVRRDREWIEVAAGPARGDLVRAL